MEIPDIFSGSLTGSPVAAGAATQASNTIDREDFLALLVAQLQNQDPLNPLESAEFSSQLAQFSSLEQLVQINSGIEALGTTGGAGRLDALGLLGREVRANSGELDLVGGEQSAISFDLSGGGVVEVEIERAGDSLGTFALGERGVGTHSLDLSELDGLPPLTDGSYTVTVRVVGSDGVTQTVPTWIRGVVTGVDLNDGKPALLLVARRVSVADVREIRTVATGGSGETDPPGAGDPAPGA